MSYVYIIIFGWQTLSLYDTFISHLRQFFWYLFHYIVSLLYTRLFIVLMIYVSRWHRTMNKSIWLVYQILNLQWIFNSCELREQTYEVVKNTKFSSISSSKVEVQNFKLCAISCLSNGNCCAASFLESVGECYFVDNDHCYDPTNAENGWLVLRIKLCKQI